jgi:LysR family transcriptional activator of nhaA
MGNLLGWVSCERSVVSTSGSVDVEMRKRRFGGAETRHTGRVEWLNYHHLLYFWLVAREGGLAPAGKILRLSQPTLSGQIRKLEESLDEKLFERDGRKLRLTEMGRVVFRYADEIFGLGKELIDTVKQRPTLRTGRLTVGIVDAVPKLLVRRLLEPAFHLAHPVSLVCHEDRLDRLLVDLAEYRLDVVISESSVPPGATLRAYNHPLGDSGMSVLAVAALATPLRRSFPRGLDGAPMLLPAAGSGLRRALDGWLAANDIRPQVAAEADDSALLKSFAADGMGVLFAPTVVADVVARRYGLVRVGDVPEVRERYFAISGERRLVHPAVVAIREAARSELFAG